MTNKNIIDINTENKDKFILELYEKSSQYTKENILNFILSHTDLTDTHIIPVGNMLLSDILINSLISLEDIEDIKQILSKTKSTGQEYLIKLAMMDNLNAKQISQYLFKQTITPTKKRVLWSGAAGIFGGIGGWLADLSTSGIGLAVTCSIGMANVIYTGLKEDEALMSLYRKLKQKGKK